eukprot:jgi/Tetstr1/454892/TSEL_041756.t1
MPCLQPLEAQAGVESKHQGAPVLRDGELRLALLVPGSADSGLKAATTVVALLAMGMASCSITRATVPVLAVPVFVEQFGYTPAMMGVLQSSILCGYFVGQVPAGFVADKMGGDRLMLLGMILWSVGTLAVPLATAAPDPLPFLIAARFLMGFTQAVIMPSVASAAARWVPVSHRSRALSVVYTGFHMGTVAGYVLTPLLASCMSWQNVFIVFGILGIVGGLKGLRTLAGLGRSAPALRPDTGTGRGRAASDAAEVVDRPLAGWAALKCRLDALLQMLVLVWTHRRVVDGTEPPPTTAIGWGFFILQSWTPTFMASLGYTDPRFMGLVSGLPWLVCAVASLNSGVLADALLTRGMARHSVRRLMQGLATLGPSLCLVPLFLPGLALSPAAQVACISGLLVMQTFSYSGFQSYLQDVAPSDAGKIIGITNSFGILIGVAGNVLTGIVLERTNDYRAIFFLTALFYTSSFAAWACVMRGQRLRIADILSPRA